MAASTARARRRSARARPPPAHSRPPRRRTHTCRSHRTLTPTRTPMRTRTRTPMPTRMRMCRTPTPRITHPGCAPRKRICLRMDAPVLTAAGHRSQRASAGQARGAGARSTSAPTASCSHTTRATSPPSSMSTLRALSPSINPKRVCRWRRETCRLRSSTRRRAARARLAGRPARQAAASSCTSTTPGTSRTATPATTSTSATVACCWAAAVCTLSTSPSSGAPSTRTSTPPPARLTPTPPCPVWRRRCKILPRICTGSEDAHGAHVACGVRGVPSVLGVLGVFGVRQARATAAFVV